MYISRLSSGCVLTIRTTDSKRTGAAHIGFDAGSTLLRTNLLHVAITRWRQMVVGAGIHRSINNLRLSHLHHDDGASRRLQSLDQESCCPLGFLPKFSVLHRLHVSLNTRSTHGRRLSRVPSVLLEGEAEHGDLLAGDGVEHAPHHQLREARLLVVIHGDHLAFSTSKGNIGSNNIAIPSIRQLL